MEWAQSGDRIMTTVGIRKSYDPIFEDILLK